MKVYFELDRKRRLLLSQVCLSRYSVSQPDVTVLETLSGRSFLQPGISRWCFALDEQSLLMQCDAGEYVPDNSITKAEWYWCEDATEKGLVRKAGRDASIFAGIGALLVPENFKIPCVLANTENVQYYGLRLIENGAGFTVSSLSEATVLMEYDYKPDYESEFLTREYGGGGYYVETHDFPHIHIPLSPTAAGHIIIGKRLHAQNYSFTAFKIPYGYALYSPSGTIHGDGTLTGKYAISVAGQETSADTVLFFNNKTLEKTDNILQ